MSKLCGNCGQLSEDLLIRCPNCNAEFSKAIVPPVRLKELEEAIYPVVRKRFWTDVWKATVVLVFGSVITLILISRTVYQGAVEYADTNLAKQVAIRFDDEHVTNTLTMVARNEAAALLHNEINPTVDSFKHDVSIQLQSVTGLAESLRKDIAGIQQSFNESQSRLAAFDTKLSTAESQLTNIQNRIASYDAKEAEQARNDAIMKTPPQVDVWLDKDDLCVAVSNGVPIQCNWTTTRKDRVVVGGITMSGWGHYFVPTTYNQVFRNGFPGGFDRTNGYINIGFSYQSAYANKVDAPGLAGSISRSYILKDGQVIPDNK